MNNIISLVEELKKQRNPLLWEENEAVLKERYASNEIEFMYFRKAKAVEYAEGLLIAQDGDGAEGLLQEFVIANLNYIDCIYKEAAFEKDMFPLEQCERSAIKLAPIFDDNTMIDIHEAIVCLKEAVVENSRLGDNIKIFAKALGE